MRSLLKFKLICVLLISFGNINAQDSFILNYEDVDIKKVTQDIAQFSKKTIILDPRVKGKITIYSNNIIIIRYFYNYVYLCQSR